MLKALKVRFSQGKQFIPDVRNASPKNFRGFPEIRPQTEGNTCKTECAACKDACPTAAISLDPIRIDLGRCIFCNECTRVCPNGKIAFTSNYKMASGSREDLVVEAGSKEIEVQVSESLHRIFGRSLKLRSVSAGGCNGCELEMSALSNVNFDISRFGIEFVASPRHADALVLSGPITRNMARALELAYDGMPDPKFVVAVGACTISGGLYERSSEIDPSFLGKFKPSLFIPGCPPHPLTFVNGILDLIGAN